MEIKKYKKIRDNKYEIIVDDSKVILYDDIIVKYSLILNKNITKGDLDKIIEENEKLSSYYKSLKYISIKLRSEKEIKHYLKRFDYDDKNITNTIARLEKEGYLNHKLYIESYINDQVLLSNNGPLKIFKFLIEQGFDEEEINKYLSKIKEEVWSSKVEKLINKRIKLNKDNLFKFKMKTNYYLQNLGYKKEIISEYLENVKISNDVKIKKDYNTILTKLSKKYEGDKLNYYLKQKLYQKGYSSEEINNIVLD